MAKSQWMKEATCYIVSRPFVIAAAVLMVLGFERLSDLCTTAGEKVPFLQCWSIFAASSTPKVEGDKSDEASDPAEAKCSTCSLSGLWSRLRSCAPCASASEESGTEDKKDCSSCSLSGLWSCLRSCAPCSSATEESGTEGKKDCSSCSLSGLWSRLRSCAPNTSASEESGTGNKKDCSSCSLSRIMSCMSSKTWCPSKASCPTESGAKSEKECSFSRAWSCLKICPFTGEPWLIVQLMSKKSCPGVTGEGGEEEKSSNCSLTQACHCTMRHICHPFSSNKDTKTDDEPSKCWFTRTFNSSKTCPYVALKKCLLNPFSCSNASDCLKNLNPMREDGKLREMFTKCPMGEGGMRPVQEGVSQLEAVMAEPSAQGAQLEAAMAEPLAQGAQELEAVKAEPLAQGAKKLESLESLESLEFMESLESLETLESLAEKPKKVASKLKKKMKPPAP